MEEVELFADAAILGIVTALAYYPARELLMIVET